jgi:hypothetical protein
MRVLPMLRPEEQTSLVHRIKFGNEYTVKNMQTIGKYLITTYEGTACQRLVKYSTAW